ncbi:hypothetical protein BOTBODRAFT_95505, partial [Botryobasidium botryosum FD-172 SS1]
SHTGEYIASLLFRIIKRIGPLRFSAITSDSTGNTKLAWEIVVKKYPTIIILPDCCHHMNNTAKDICKPLYFKGATSQLRTILKYFKKSSFAKAHLTAYRICQDIKIGLVTIGNTQFLTIYYSSVSVLWCLIPIQELIHTRVITLTPVSVHVMSGILKQLKAILEPLARAVKCLESTMSTPADVYLFWLAVMATYEELFQNNDEVDGLQLPPSVLEEIRGIINARYRQMIEDPEKVVYVSTLFLDPSEF